MTIDLNCDLGEGAGRDAELMPLISSANIACGAHAGDLTTMQATVELAQRWGVAIGAHPGYADRGNFGRREIAMSTGELGQLVAEQIVRLREIAPLAHVKPHGALYNVAARDRQVAETIAQAVAAIDPSLVLFALAGSELARAGRAHGLRVAEEVFADRTYRRDGALTPRGESGALIEEETAAVSQVLRMVREGQVQATDGTRVSVRADTVCLHGDGAHAVTFARRLRQELAANGIEVRAPETVTR